MLKTVCHIGLAFLILVSVGISAWWGLAETGVVSIPSPWNWFVMPNTARCEKCGEIAVRKFQGGEPRYRCERCGHIHKW